MPWIQPEQTTRLTPPAGLPGLDPATDWIDIRSVYTVALRDAAVSAAMKFRITGGAVADDMDFDALAYKRTIVKGIVVAWSDPAPVTPEMIGQLAPEVHDWIAEEFDRLAGMRSEPEKKDSEKSFSSGLPAAEASPPSSASSES